MPVIRLDHITRSLVRSHRDRIFMFGDNMERAGFGGQAAEMRGEPNTIGVPTKWSPRRHDGAYFKDSDWDYFGVRITIQSAFATARMFLDAGVMVVVPSAGFGSGLADLARRAPRIHEAIEHLTRGLSYGETDHRRDEQPSVDAP